MTATRVCAACGRYRTGTFSPLGVCAPCRAPQPYGDEGMSSSHFDDDLAGERDQRQEMREEVRTP